MRRLISLVSLATVVISTFLISPSTVFADPDTTNCLYPTPADRFSITVYADQEIDDFDITPLMARSYLNWRADLTPSQPNAMSYHFMVRVSESGHRPSVDALKTIALNNPGATWIIGNEADVIWQDNTSPAAYARAYHSAYTAIKSVDPTARFVMNGIAQVSPLRLAWMNQAWDSYLATYGHEMPVDIWNIHTYVAHEMHQAWGAEIPPGIDNAVGYSDRLGTDWAEEIRPGASGGTVHRSRTVDARAFFAFHGDQVTIHLGTGPDAGIADIYLNQLATPVAEVDLYAPTPGTISRSYTDLTSPGGLLQGRHNIRVQVTGRGNPASSNTWIRVDAIQAPSTASLPDGRFEDNSPLRATIVSSLDDHDNIDLIKQQTRNFRQWMADHGQRNKPLINTEYGILMTEDLGFDYPRVRTFMLNSFDTFLNDMIDPALGYPADGNRLLQEWYWFALAIEEFEGRTTHTGLFDTNTRAIKPLGTDFANYVQPLHQDYVDLEVSEISVTPYWPIFAGDLSLLRIRSQLRNRGNIASGPFDVTFRAGNGSWLATQPFAGLPKRYDPGDLTTVTHDWSVVLSTPRGMKVIADENNQVSEPCETNNEAYVQVTPQPSTDLALS
ncbi:MAG TPA: CARDB domain-containing protein, partial [Anaerolineae bacterium]|nr:CARDB domain-containing protein [Anaerolineae bacterium]